MKNAAVSRKFFGKFNFFGKYILPSNIVWNILFAFIKILNYLSVCLVCTLFIIYLYYFLIFFMSDRKLLNLFHFDNGELLACLTEIFVILVFHIFGNFFPYDIFHPTCCTKFLNLTCFIEVSLSVFCRKSSSDR